MLSMYTPISESGGVNASSRLIRLPGSRRVLGIGLRSHSEKVVFEAAGDQDTALIYCYCDRVPEIRSLHIAGMGGSRGFLQVLRAERRRPSLRAYVRCLFFKRAVELLRGFSAK